MRETPRPQGTVGDARSWPPQLRPGRAFAHTPGVSGSGTPHRSDGRPPQTPRGVRHTDQDGRPGTTPPVPGRPNARWGLRTQALCALLLLFGLLTWQVAGKGPLRRLDERFGLAARQTRILDTVAEFFADLGSVTIAVPVLAGVAGYVAWQARRTGAPRWWLPPLAATLAMAAVPLLVVPLKLLIDRPGPPGMAGHGFYPSGHTATAAVAYGAATLLMLPYLRGSAYTRREVVIGCLLLNATVGFGLVRRGYHWPLDVLGSWCLFGALLVVLSACLDRFGDEPGSSSPSSGRPAQPSP
ncbi:phosphatase PAP2 family protein [Streptomyces sp. PSKA54]|uniref:Phosphatase PAP2 family protein n=1 Tax=Streptomyces himalayensis subsp. aureolus TaxID=2758039 RepID=A0A7W2HK99_9ACTN|nr:phosphatase PAP2 family protein [Streptomyces himalayensis subsp. aureolus]